MKHIIYSFFAFMLLFVTGCIKDAAEFDSLEGDNNTITIDVTRGLISGDGTANSAQVEKIRIIAFDAVTNKVEANLFTGDNTLKEESGTSKEVSNFTISLPSKEYLLYVIANETEGMNLGAVSNYYEADAAVIALGTYDETTVPMGKVVKIKVLPDPDDSKKAVVQTWNGTDWGVQAKQVNVELERLHARTRLFVRKSVDEAVTITGVELVRVAPQSWFAAKSTSAVGISTVSSMMAASTTIASKATDAQIAKPETEIFADYTVGGFTPITLSKNIFPENLLTHSLNKEENATALHITYTYDSGSDQKTINSYVPLRNGTAGTDYKILRNRSYDIYATVEQKSTNIIIDILDWKDIPVTGDIYGASLEVNKTVFNIPVGSSETLTVEAVEPSTTFTFLGYGNAVGTGTMSSTTPTGYNISGQPAVGVATTLATVTIESKTECGAVYMWYRAGNIKKRVELASKIDPANYVFEVTSPASFTHLGGTNQYTVTSYLKDGSTNTPVAWTALEVWNTTTQKWEPFTTKPASWVTTFTTSGNGSDSAASLSAGVDEQKETTTSVIHDDILKAAAEVGTTANPYDLSQGGETANCYIVNAPGTYSIPLIYGNARKADGTVNTDAFTAAERLYILPSFLSATGTIPADGKITGAEKAELIWQDAQDLVRVDATLGGTTANPTLTFTVPAGNICQGNAVVAVRDASNRVLWSWHIWVTDYNPEVDHPKSFVNATGYTYKFMPVNLGWCDGLIYPARSVKVRFTQEESGIRKTIDLKQLEGQGLGNNPYYQWGRKDPFVGALAGNVNKTWYSADYPTGTATDPPFTDTLRGDSTAAPARVIITYCILNPGTYCANVDMDFHYYNLWDAAATSNASVANDNPIVKTIYDPSPVGYHMPAGNAFSGFTTTGRYSFTASEFNTTGNFDEGWTFSKAGSDDVFFPATGRRDNSMSSALISVGSMGNYWSAGPFFRSSGYTLGIGSGSVLFGDGVSSYRALGCSVRPVAEE